MKPQEEEEEVNSSSTTTMDAGSSTASASAARRALFSAVEGGRNGTDDVLSTRPLVKLFFKKQSAEWSSSTTTTGNTDESSIDDDDNNDLDQPLFGDDVSEKEQQTILGDVIKSPKFNKGHARRLFAGLTGILRIVVENEDYVPASAYENDDDVDADIGADADLGLEGGTNNAALRTSFGSSIMTGGGGGGPGTISPNDIEPDVQSTEALLFMRACCLLLESYLDGLADRRPPSATTGSTTNGNGSGNAVTREYAIIDEAFQVAELLHDSLFSLQSCGPVAVRVQASVSSLCESWWHKSFEGREQLVTMLVPLLVAKTLDGAAQKSDVRRLFVMREALDLLDFADPSIDYLRSLLLRTASSPHYLRTVEGRRIIAHIFQLDVDLVQDLHRSIRVQIPDAKKTILDAYGDIYLRSWKDSEDDEEIRTAIEEHALQDLMVSCLHLADAKLAKSVRTVLSPLHRAKKSPDVDKLLHRMYGPILWRALSAANPIVRLNATPVLADTFPLRDPDEGEDRTEAVVGKTVDALMALLRDPAPKIRVAGSNAAGRILVAFWDALPTSDIRRLLGEIITKHSSDASSAAVRAEAVATVSLLIEAEHSRAVLRPLLPSIGNLIHDKVERVRLAVVKMLVKIKKIRGLKYYHVVPVEHLLARLQAEGEVLDNPTGPVATELTGLMLNSYFPQGDGVTGSDQIKRTLMFLTNNGDAASIFYQNIAFHLSTGSVAKLAAMLLRCLSAAIEADVKADATVTKATKKGKKRSRDQPTADEENGSDKTLNASNTKLMASIAETICCLWESISSSLSEADQEEVRGFLIESFSGSTLTDALTHFERKYEDAVENENKTQQIECRCIGSALLRCAGNLTPAVVDGLASHISSMEVTAESNVTAHMALLCVWGMEEDVAKSIGKSIKRGLVGERNDDEMLEEPRRRSTKRNARSEKKTSDDDVPFATMPAPLAVSALNAILHGSDPSCVVARDAILDSPSACNELEKALDVATNAAEMMLKTTSDFSSDDAKVSLMLATCEAYGKMALHKEGRKEVRNSQLSSQIKTLLYWVSSRVVPVVTKDSSGISNDGSNKDTTSPLGDLDLSRISVGSNVSATGPMSPAEPPKRRSNRGKTPQKLDETFELDVDKIASFDVDKASNVPIAVYLIKSALIIFAEWISISGTGSAEIASKAAKWIDVLKMDCDEIDIKKELIPAFIRLSYQVARKGDSSTLAEAVVTACSDDLDEGCAEEGLVTKLVSYVNKLADKENGVNAIGLPVIGQ